MLSTKSRLLAILFVVVAAFQANAQREETLLGSRNWGFSGIWGGYTHQFTLYDNNDTYNRGGFFGFEFGKSLNVGWGHYRTNETFNWQGQSDQKFNMKWNVAKVGYSFIPYKAVHPMLNVDFGRGTVDINNVRDRVLVVQPSAGIEINVFRWFRVGLEGGYRFVSGSDLAQASNTQLSAPYGQASLKFGFSWGRYHKRPAKDRDKD